MNFLRPIAMVALFCAASSVTFAAPRDRIDPATIKDKVSLKLGTKGTIQFKAQGDVLAEPKLVKDAPENAAGVGAELSKSDNLIMLRVQNRFAKNLHYRAAIRLKGRTDFVETSLIPVKAGLLSFESWGDPIEEIILFEFKLTDEKL
jgi:hypothetical protein